MPYYNEYNNVFSAYDEWDRIRSQNLKVASLMFFQDHTGNITSPFFVWGSEEGEAVHIARAETFPGQQFQQNMANNRSFQNASYKLRNFLADHMASSRVGTPGYRQKGHSEEFLIQDFPICLTIAGGISNVATAQISVSWSPCVAERDSKASNSLGPGVGCFGKLVHLAQQYPSIHFEVNFKEGFGSFAHNGRGAEQYMNQNSPTNNISFSYFPQLG